MWPRTLDAAAGPGVISLAAAPAGHTWLGLEVELAVGLAMFLALAGYVVLGGADFGGGIWDLLAAGPRRDLQRLAIARAMGPVWEANHVWLIFLTVILFTAFPTAFAALAVAFFIPLHLVLAGIVLRGAAFVFRAAHRDITSKPARTWATVFGVASVITPFLLGAALGAVSSGGIRVVDGAVRVDPLQAWFSPVSLMIGALTLALCAYLAAVYLTVETEGDLREDFRMRALGAGGAVALLAVILLPLIASRSPVLWEHLSAPASIVPIVAGGVLAGLSAWAVWARRFPLARVASVAEVVIILGGWAFGQWPYLIYPDVTVYEGGATGPSLRFLLSTLPYGFATLIPSLWLLFRVFKGNPNVRVRS